MAPNASTSSLRTRLDDVIRGESRICLILICISFCQFQVGYDSVVTAGFQGMPGFLAVYGYKDPSNPLGYNLSTHVQTLVQSLMIMGSLISSLLVFLIGSRVSRRTAMWTACVLSIVAVTIQIASTDLAALYIGRLLLGFSNGIFTPYIQIYITESAPHFLLGSLLTNIILVNNLGALIGVIINNSTQGRPDRLSYQIPMSVIYFSPVFIGTLLFFLPDTPRYYVLKADYDNAANAIRRLRGLADEDVIRQEVEDMKNAHNSQQELKGNVQLWDIFKGTDLRRTLLMYGATAAQVVTGIGFLMQYSVYFLAQARIADPFLWVMITYIISLTGNVVGSILMRYVHRKTVLLPGLAVMAVSMFVMAIANSVLGTSVTGGRVLVAMYIIHTWISAAATMPAATCLNAEIASQRLRPEMAGTSSVILWGLAWLVSYTTPYFINPEQLNWGPKYAYIWGASCVVVAGWAWAFLPETKGRSLEQIDELFRRRVPARKFRTAKVEHEHISNPLERRESSSKEDALVVEEVVEIKGE